MTEQEKAAVEFDQAHEGEDGHVISGNNYWVLFADGAKRSVNCWGVAGYQLTTFEPDSKEIRASQKEFWTIKLENLVNDFEQLKSQTRNTNGGHFKQRVEQLKELQTAVRSARTKVSRLATLERGYTQADIQKAWECWQEFSEAAAAESITKQRYDGLLLGKSSPGVLEKAKSKHDEAKRRASRAMERWNSFTPEQARSIVAEELDQQARAEREHELSEIEV